MESMLIAIANKVGIAPILLLAVCTAETKLKNVDNFNDGGSPSYGLCQVKLGTARMFNKKVTQRDLQDPKKNVYYSALYIKRQLRRYDGDIPLAVAAYNRGTAKLNEYGNLSNSRHVIKVLVNMYEREKEDRFTYQRSLAARNNGHCKFPVADGNVHGDEPFRSKAPVVRSFKQVPFEAQHRTPVGGTDK